MTAVRRALVALAAREHRLWVLALLGVVLDLGATVVGLRVGLVETNPVAVAALAAAGAAGLVALKAACFGVAVAGWAVLPRPYRAVVPAAAALPWLAAGLYNLGLIAVVIA